MKKQYSIKNVAFTSLLNSMFRAFSKASVTSKKTIVPIVFLFALFLAPTATKAQGFIECATILNDENGFPNNEYRTLSINGLTYIYFGPQSNGGIPATQLPTVNGDAWGNGGDTQAYLGVFDDNCNIVFGTYIGGSEFEDGRNLEVDASGNIIVTGETSSPDFVTTDGTISTANGVSRDVFIRKYAPDGTLLFSTVYGGAAGREEINNMVLDGTDIYITGATRSIDFPTTNGTTYSGAGAGGIFFQDAFLLKLDGSGNVQYAAVYGGTGSEVASAIAVINGMVFV